MKLSNQKSQQNWIKRWSNKQRSPKIMLSPSASVVVFRALPFEALVATFRASSHFSFPNPRKRLRKFAHLNLITTSSFYRNQTNLKNVTWKTGSSEHWTVTLFWTVAPLAWALENPSNRWKFAWQYVRVATKKKGKAIENRMKNVVNLSELKSILSIVRLKGLPLDSNAVSDWRFDQNERQNQWNEISRR